MSNKNTNAIDKIFKELVYKDYESALKRWKKKIGKNKYYKDGTPKQFPGYSLSAESWECWNIKEDYISGNVSEEEYKSYCLKHNLRMATEN